MIRHAGPCPTGPGLWEVGLIWPWTFWGFHLLGRPIASTRYDPTDTIETFGISSRDNRDVQLSRRDTAATCSCDRPSCGRPAATSGRRDNMPKLTITAAAALL